jgi:hypothetical protein
MVATDHDQKTWDFVVKDYDRDFSRGKKTSVS